MTKISIEFWFGENGVEVHMDPLLSQEAKMQMLEALELEICGESYQALEERLSSAEDKIQELEDTIDYYENYEESDHISDREFL